MTQAAAAAAEAKARTDAAAKELDEVEHEIDQLTSRAAAVNNSLDNLQRQQAAAGLGLRGDMAPKQASMKNNLAKAQDALHRNDLERARRYELRGDLRCLSLCRREGACEPEDHAGVLCEILAIICREDSGVPFEQQGSFFRTHALPWLPRFFRDLQGLQSAVFYRDVGILGEVFMNTEERYLSPTEFTGDEP